MLPIFRCFQIFASIFVILLGVSLLLVGSYACIVLGFFGGIATIMDAIKATPTDPLSLCWGTVKILFCWIPELAGVLACWFLTMLGLGGLADYRYSK